MTSARVTSARAGYIVSPGYDWAFFLLPPIASLFLGILVSGSAYSDAPITILGEETTWAEVSLGALIHAHLVAVFFRTHGNTQIFPLYPVRFIWIPLALWLAISSSVTVAVAATVVATFWDVWHSGAQTFGFARIYDRNAGVPTKECRRLEFWMNQLLYAGPILGGATMLDHVSTLADFEDVGSTFFSAVPIAMERNQSIVTMAVLAAGTLLALAYVSAHIRAYRRGIRFSRLKVFLVASTGLCSIYTWGFNSWGEAFFIMNLFHAVQYLALVWAMEHKQLHQRMSRGASSKSKVRTAAVFFGAVAAYGLVAQLSGHDLDALWSLTIVVSLMHFWYDGFVWSVRKQQI
jgi:hypothetical protein